ncbi:MAG TPA: hypothetical protein VGE67_18880 [Haloferula sp.]
MKLTPREIAAFLAGVSVVSILWIATSSVDERDQAARAGDANNLSLSSPGRSQQTSSSRRPREAGHVSESPAPGILAEGGVITPATKREWGLSDEQATKCQEILRGTQEEAGADLMSNMRKDKTLDDLEGGGVAYFVEANPNLHSRLHAKILREIGEVAGSRVAGILANEVSEKHQYLRLGRSDLVFRLYPSAAPGREPVVSYEFRNPATYEYQGGGRRGLKGVNESMGLDLHFPD